MELLLIQVHVWSLVTIRVSGIDGSRRGGLESARDLGEVHRAR